MDRVALEHEFGKQPVEAWRRDGVPYWQHATVRVGRLADGRWFAEHTGIPHGYASTDEREVRAVVDDWLTDGYRWVPAPAAYDGSARPDDGRRWRKTGAEWVLDE